MNFTAGGEARVRDEAPMTEPGVVVRSVAWSAIESATLIILSFATLMVIARLIGPADFGVASTVLVVIQFLNVAVEGLFNETLVQRAEVKDAHIDSAMWTALGVAVFLILACWAAAGPAAYIYGEPRLAPLLRVGSLLLLFSGYSGVKVAMIRRSFAFRALALRTLLARLTGCTVGLLMAWSNFGPWSLIAQSLVAAILGAVALWYWSPRRVHRMPRIGPLRDLLKFAAPWLVNELALVSVPKIYQMVAAYIFGPFQFGLLGMGFRITDTLKDLIGHIATNVGLPLFARVQHDRQRLARQFLIATSTICIIAIPSFAGVVICARTIVEAVLGPTWLPSALLMQMLSLGAAGGFAAIFSYQIFSALGRPAQALPLSVLDVLVSVGLLFAASRFGILAASLVWSLRQILSATVLLSMCMRMLQLRPRQIARTLRQPLMLTVVFSALLWPLNEMLASLSPVLRLMVLVPSAGVMLLAGVAVVRPDLVRVVWAQIPAGMLVRRRQGHGRQPGVKRGIRRLYGANHECVIIMDMAIGVDTQTQACWPSKRRR